MNLDLTFMVRVVGIGLIVGLIVYFFVDNNLGLGWMLGYLSSILISKINEIATYDISPQKEEKKHENE